MVLFMKALGVPELPGAAATATDMDTLRQTPVIATKIGLRHYWPFHQDFRVQLNLG